MRESTHPNPNPGAAPEGAIRAAGKSAAKKTGSAHDPAKALRRQAAKAEQGRSCRRAPIASDESSWFAQLDELTRQAVERPALGELDHWLARCAARLDARKAAVESLEKQLNAIGSPAEIPSSAWRAQAAMAWEKHALALSCQDNFGDHAGRAWSWAMASPAMAEAAGTGFGIWSLSRGIEAKSEVGKLCLELLWPSGLKSKTCPEQVAGAFAEALAKCSPQWAAKAAEELLESIAVGASRRGPEHDVAACRLALRMLPRRAGAGSASSWAWIMAGMGARTTSSGKPWPSTSPRPSWRFTGIAAS